MQPVRILVFIDQNMVEAAADIVGKSGVAHHLRPVEQQVVVIEDVLALLRLNIGGKQLLEFGGPPRTPRERRAQDLLNRDLGVDATGVDGKARSLGGKPVHGFGKSKVVPNQVHQIRGIFAIVDGKGRVEPDLLGILAQQARPDAMERAGPRQGIGHHAGLVAHRLPRDPFNPLCHLGCRPPRKRHEQDPPRVGAVDDQVGNPVRQGVGLAGTGTGNHQKRAAGQSCCDRPCSTARRCSELRPSR